MSARAKASGAVGTVVDGRFRDLQEQRALDYPVRPYYFTTLRKADHQLRSSPAM